MKKIIVLSVMFLSSLALYAPYESPCAPFCPGTPPLQVNSLSRITSLVADRLEISSNHKNEIVDRIIALHHLERDMNDDGNSQEERDRKQHFFSNYFRDYLLILTRDIQCITIRINSNNASDLISPGEAQKYHDVLSEYSESLLSPIIAMGFALNEFNPNLLVTLPQMVVNALDRLDNIIE